MRKADTDVYSADYSANTLSAAYSPPPFEVPNYGYNILMSLIVPLASSTTKFALLYEYSVLSVRGYDDPVTEVADWEPTAYPLSKFWAAAAVKYTNYIFSITDGSLNALRFDWNGSNSFSESNSGDLFSTFYYLAQHGSTNFFTLFGDDAI